jgi:antitoxin ParD1/3/4
MACVAKLSIALTAEMADEVRQAVESGNYASGSEVIREALREWKLRRNLPPQTRDELRHLWQQGLSSGRGRLGDIKAVKREARRRLRGARGEAR